MLNRKEQNKPPHENKKQVKIKNEMPRTKKKQKKTIRAATWQNQQNECAPSEDSDQPWHPPCLIRVFAVHMKKAWVLKYPLSGQRRLWSDWADAQADRSSRWAHSHFVGFIMLWLIKLYIIGIASFFFLFILFSFFSPFFIFLTQKMTPFWAINCSLVLTLWKQFDLVKKKILREKCLLKCIIVDLYFFRGMMFNSNWLSHNKMYWETHRSFSVHTYILKFEPRHDKTNNMSVRPVWSESSLSAWRKLGSLATH